MLWSDAGSGLGAIAAVKRRADRPYVLGPVVQPDDRGLVVSRTRRPTTCWAFTRR